MISCLLLTTGKRCVLRPRCAAGVLWGKQKVAVIPLDGSAECIYIHPVV